MGSALSEKRDQQKEFAVVLESQVMSHLLQRRLGVKSPTILIFFYSGISFHFVTESLELADRGPYLLQFIEDTAAWHKIHVRRHREGLPIPLPSTSDKLRACTPPASRRVEGLPDICAARRNEPRQRTEAEPRPLPPRPDRQKRQRGFRERQGRTMGPVRGSDRRGKGAKI